nr:unnamed protein product [Digitaria exilis]
MSAMSTCTISLAMSSTENGTYWAKVICDLCEISNVLLFEYQECDGFWGDARVTHGDVDDGGGSDDDGDGSDDDRTATPATYQVTLGDSLSATAASAGVTHG